MRQTPYGSRQQPATFPGGNLSLNLLQRAGLGPGRAGPSPRNWAGPSTRDESTCTVKKGKS